MFPRKKTRDLARRLVSSEAGASSTSLQTESATVRVYERLCRQLGAPAGAGGFQALASRALARAKPKSPPLSTVVLPGVRGLDEVQAKADVEEGGEAGIILIAQLLGLFLIFLGEGATLRLIEDIHLQIQTEAAAANSAMEIPSADDALFMAEAFEDLLLEIARLRNVSEHLEILANDHSGMKGGLVSAAGNIRTIATLLDVFTLIRSKAGGLQEEPPDLPKDRYLN